MRSRVLWRLKLARSIRYGIAACGMVLFSCPGLFAEVQAVQVWQGTLTIPTYQLGPSDPDPAFPLVNPHDVYPYRMQDDLTGNRVLKTYQALYLENRYLRVIVLPQLGGHVYSIYDKVNHREVLYRNHVIKYGLVGPRGAWMAGGLEFSFPFAHTMITVSPIESMIRTHPDGSGSVDIGAIDWVSGMYWEVALTLRPQSASLQQDVTLYNATPEENLYLFWTNAAVKATEDLEYIYPMREVIRDDPFAPVLSWPTWDGIDHSRYKNVPSAMTIFGRSVQQDFFGIYYQQADYGVVHVANFRQDPGKKIFTWGTARSGRIWDTLLSDNDGPYTEIQSGIFYTQGYREFMQPRRVQQWTEYWYPVSGLKDGFVDATRQVALNVDFPPAAAKGRDVILRVSPIATNHSVILQVKQGDKLLMNERGVDLEPLHPVTYVVPVGNAQAAQRSLEVDVLSSAGVSILHWSKAAPLDGNPDFSPRAGMALRTKVPDSPQTPTEALYLRGVLLQESGDMPGALKLYHEVLQRDPNYIPALLKLAWYWYRNADFSQAEGLIARAEQREQNDPQVEYAAGVIDRAEGRLNEAKNAFWAVRHYRGPDLPSLVEQGEIEIRQGNPRKAETLLQRAITCNPDDALSLADLSLAERLDGELEVAAVPAGRAISKMPLLPYAVAEQVQSEGKYAVTANSEQDAAAKWKEIINRDPENVLAVAAWYHSLGAWRSADRILMVAKADPVSTPLMPMIDYYLASDARHEGDALRAKQDAQQAAQIRTVGVLPSRLEDVAVLSEELHVSPTDAQAQYELGNFLFAHNRYDEAAHLWSQALRLGFDNPVILRNMGLYAWLVKHDLGSAAADYLQAIKLSPKQYRYYCDLDEIYEEEGKNGARAALFQKAPPEVLSHDTVQARYALFQIEQKRYQEALADLSTHNFVPWEGGVAIHDLFVAANMQLGEQALAERAPAEAEKYFRAAMRYPENLGTGQPAQPDAAEQFYWLGNAYQAQGKLAQAQAMWRNAAKQEVSRGGACEVFAALAFRKLGEQGAARPLLEECIDHAARPGATAAEFVGAGLVEEDAQNNVLARTDFQRALAVDPLYWEAHIALNTIQPGNQ